MKLLHTYKFYQTWAPVVGRVMFGILFLTGAFFKIPTMPPYAMEVGMTAAHGVPFASIAVILALIIEVVGGVALIIGWRTRTAACFLAFYTLLLTLIFHFDLSDPAQFGQFISHLGLIGGLLYISVYGAHTLAVKKCPYPHGVSEIS